MFLANNTRTYTTDIEFFQSEKLPGIDPFGRVSKISISAFICSVLSVSSFYIFAEHKESELKNWNSLKKKQNWPFLDPVAHENTKVTVERKLKNFYVEKSVCELSFKESKYPETNLCQNMHIFSFCAYSDNKFSGLNEKIVNDCPGPRWPWMQKKMINKHRRKGVLIILFSQWEIKDLSERNQNRYVVDWSPFINFMQNFCELEASLRRHGSSNMTKNWWKSQKLINF